MLKLLLFLRRIHYVLLFIALEVIAVSVFIRSNTYHRAKIAGVSNILTGWVYNQTSDVSGYFGLKAENQRLLEENGRLLAELTNDRVADSLFSEDHWEASEAGAETLHFYEYQTARVLNNRVTKRENYITINKGSLDGIEPEMALITDDGIVGYVVSCSPHFSIAASILNTKLFRTSGCIKGSDFAGSIYWDGENYEEVILDEIPKYAQMAIGDTITTTFYSYIFPPEQPIGTIASYEMVNGTFYKIRVKLFADMTRLRNVYVIRYLDQEERRALEATIGNQELPAGGIVDDRPRGQALRERGSSGTGGNSGNANDGGGAI